MPHYPVPGQDADLVTMAAAFTDRLDAVVELIAISDALPVVQSHSHPRAAIDRLTGRLLDETQDLARMVIATPALGATGREAKRAVLETYRCHFGQPGECLEAELALSLLADFFGDSNGMATVRCPHRRPPMRDFVFARACATRARDARPVRESPRTSTHTAIRKDTCEGGSQPGGPT